MELCFVHLWWMRSFKPNALLLMLFLQADAFVMMSYTTYKIHTSITLFSVILLVFVRILQHVCSNKLLLFCKLWT